MVRRETDGLVRTYQVMVEEWRVEDDTLKFAIGDWVSWPLAASTEIPAWVPEERTPPVDVVVELVGGYPVMHAPGAVGLFGGPVPAGMSRSRSRVVFWYDSTTPTGGTPATRGIVARIEVVSSDGPTLRDVESCPQDLQWLPAPASDLGYLVTLDTSLGGLDPVTEDARAHALRSGRVTLRCHECALAYRATEHEVVETGGRCPRCGSREFFLSHEKYLPQPVLRPRFRRNPRGS